MRGAARLLALGAVLGASVAPASAASAASAAERTDLTVPRAAVHFADGRLSGYFVVHASGRATGRTAATLGVRVGSRRILVRRFVVSPLRRGTSRKVVLRAVTVPAGLPVGTRAITACADSGHRVRERSETNNCRRVATLVVGRRAQAPAPPVASTPSAPPPPISRAPAGPPPVDASASTIPTDPVAFQKDAVFQLQSSMSPYWVYVPSGYDETHATPTTLFVWLHGCGERSPEKIVGVSPGGSQSWISIAPGGRESACWDPNADVPLVLAAIADVKQHFNINARRVVLGGFSSGGDLAYRLIYEDANVFAGLLAEGTTPFRDTGCPSPEECMAQTAWKVNIVHLAHLGDTAYDIARVRSETDTLKAAGFPITRIERDGQHYEDDTATSGTVHDVRAYLLPHLNDPWLAPAR